MHKRTMNDSLIASVPANHVHGSSCNLACPTTRPELAERAWSRTLGEGSSTRKPLLG
jgi:hypothetical protein